MIVQRHTGMTDDWLTVYHCDGDLVLLGNHTDRCRNGVGEEEER